MRSIYARTTFNGNVTLYVFKCGLFSLDDYFRDHLYEFYGWYNPKEVKEATTIKKKLSLMSMEQINTKQARYYMSLVNSGKCVDCWGNSVKIRRVD